MAEMKLTKQNFENEVIKSDKPVLVDFWAAWRNPCRMTAFKADLFTMLK